MAKKWKPTQRQIAIYDELVKKQNEIRRWILRRHKDAETEGAGNPRLPALVVPKKAYSSNRISFQRIKKEVFKRRIREMRELYGSLEDYLRPFKKNFLSGLAGMIEAYGGGKPSKDLRNPLYTLQQIEDNPQIADAMHLYNRYATMSPAQFYDMYYRGYIVQLKYIYTDMKGEAKELSFIDEQIELMRIYRRTLTNSGQREDIGYTHVRRRNPKIRAFENGKNK